MPPRITIKSEEKKSAMLRRGVRNNYNVRTKQSRSENYQMNTCANSIVVEGKPNDVVVPQEKNSGNTSVVGAVVPNQPTESSKSKRTRHRKREKSLAEFQDIEKIVPPKITIMSDKNSALPRRTVRNNNTNKISTNQSRSKNDQMNKCANSIVAGRDSDKVVTPQVKKSGGTSVVGAVVPSQSTESSKPKRTRHRKREKSSAEFQDIETIVPPKITIMSDKNSALPRRTVRNNNTNKVSTNQSRSENDQMNKCANSIVAGRDSDKVVTPQVKKYGGTSVVGAVVPSQSTESSKPKRTRHRKQEKSTWAREITKNNREHGLAYIGYEMTEKGVVHGVDRPARELGPRCESKFCLKSNERNCHDVDEMKRVALFNRFWSEMDWDAKAVYVASLVDKDDTEVKVSEESRRNNTFKYFLKIDNKRIHVCKTFFLSSLGLNEWMVENWATNNTDGIIPAKALVNARRKANRTPSKKSIAVQQKKDFLVKFFSELPKLPSHYCRQRTDRQYIEPNFQSLAELYRYYQMCCNESNSESNEPNSSSEISTGVNNSKTNCLSYGYFCDFFKELKLSLYQPRKDRCDTCVAFENGNIAEEEYNHHILKKNRARKEKDDDKKKAIAGEAHVFAWDVEAVKLAPQNKAGLLYYKIKLKNHNFSIYDLQSTDCTNNWWNEADGGMDASMFITCGIDFLNEKCNDDLPIIIWSDGCGYQNRNQILSNALLDYAVRHKKSVQQKFLVKGHTQMEVDNVHALIEDKLKGRNIDLPSDYVKITEEARLTKPLKARLLHYGDFRNYNDPRLFRYHSIRPGKSVGDDTVQHLRMLHYDPNGTISYKIDFDDDLKSLPQKPKKPTLSYETLEPCYHEEIKISAKRYSDLQDLKPVIPSKAHAFYDNLKHE